jgi:hypothetical protein
MFRTPLTQWEQNLRRMPVHISEFVPVAEPLALSGCGDVRPPEALLTPDPMLQVQDDDLHVRVSFIVGSDGHVLSPFILDSGGPEQDQLILRPFAVGGIVLPSATGFRPIPKPAYDSAPAKLTVSPTMASVRWT